MSVSLPDSLIGTVLGGRYEILARVNRGGTAVVYRGTDRRLGRTVAIKVIHSDLSGDPDYVKRFDREARAAAILSHPNIVAIFDQGMAGDRPYIVMEFIRGQSLRSIISSSAPLPPSLALSYTDEVAKALAAAHDAGIIHRDIKPENVMITNDGQVKVADFGLAKILETQTSTASQGVLMGTMSYIAPEIPASGATAKASDIYSTGVVLYEMLTGKKPHTGDDFSQVIYKHINEDIRPPSEALSGQAKAKIPDYVDALVTACTARDQTRRPADGRALEEMVAQARRSLDAGVMHDPALVTQFSHIEREQENTPVAPLLGPSQVRSTGKTGSGSVVKPAPVTKLAKAPADFSKSSGRKPGGEATRGGGTTPKNRRGLIILVFLVVFAVAVAILSYWLAVGRWTTIPQLAGMTLNQATTEANAHDIILGTPLQAYDEVVPVGQVIKTDPPQGTRVSKGSTITVTVSKGQERYPMPTVVGLSEADAKTALLAAHLAEGAVTTAFSDDYASGVVISASKDSGDSLPPNTTVDLVVSKGPEPIAIPNVIGKTPDDATATLTNLGFKVNVDSTRSQYSSSIDAGNVVSQDPDAGTSSNPATGHHGDTITLGLSLGPKMIEVPNVNGFRRADAQQALSAAGFIVQFNDVNPSSFKIGVVVGTDPYGGAMAAEGSTVTVNVV